MVLGPAQDEDVLLLQAVIKITCPLKLVELGHLNGYSAKKILEVMREDAVLTSYDPTVNSNINDPRFIFKKQGQEEYNETEVDFIFFDASHDLEINKQTFLKVLPTLNKNAIIAVHDTGLWNTMVLDTGGYWIDNGYAHRPDERAFVNWLQEQYNFNAIHFHTLRETRHGMTLLQLDNTLNIVI